MMSAMRSLASLALASALVVLAVATAGADSKPFLGRWNLMGTGADSNAVFWLEVKEEGGVLAIRYQRFKIGVPDKHVV